VIYIAYTIHIVVCLFLILVVLLQQGKGADLSVFGGGATQSAFGARGAATLLHKLTVAGFIAFIFTTVGIGLLQTGGKGGSVMSTVVEEEAAATPAPEVELPTAESPAAATVPEDASETAAEEALTDEAETETESEPPGADQ
jgi:preprotein translocase subunit SecG